MPSYEKELVYKEYLQREDIYIRATYDTELAFYSSIRMGKVEAVTHHMEKSFLEKVGFGTLSKNPLQNIKFHFVVTAALVARYCIEGGMEVSQAYNLSDFYIQKADLCSTPLEVSDLHASMCLDYAKRMKKIQKTRITSLPIANCLDYIYDHLHTRITVATLAKHVGLNPSYLSRLFKKEVGISVSEYILEKKLETAKNMLIHSDYPLSQIAFTLAFPSQSYFTEVFHKKNGMTPSSYRSQNFRIMNQ